MHLPAPRSRISPVCNKNSTELTLKRRRNIVWPSHCFCALRSSLFCRFYSPLPTKPWPIELELCSIDTKTEKKTFFVGKKRKRNRAKNSSTQEKFCCHIFSFCFSRLEFSLTLFESTKEKVFFLLSSLCSFKKRYFPKEFFVLGFFFWKLLGIFISFFWKIFFKKEIFER